MKRLSRLLLSIVLIVSMLGLYLPTPARADTTPIPNEVEVNWEVTITSSNSWSSESERDDGTVYARYNGNDSFTMHSKGTTELEQTALSQNGNPYLSPKSDSRDYSLGCQGGGTYNVWNLNTLHKWTPEEGWQTKDFQSTTVEAWQYGMPGNSSEHDLDDNAISWVEIIPPESENESLRYRMLIEPFFFIDYDTLGDYLDIPGSFHRNWSNFEGSHSESGDLNNAGQYGAPSLAEYVWYDRMDTALLGSIVEGELTFGDDKFRDSGSINHTVQTDDGQAEITIKYEINKKPGIKSIQPNQALGRYQYKEEDNYEPATDFVSGKNTAVQVFFDPEIPVESVRDVTVEVSRDGSTVATLTNFRSDTENNCLIFIPQSRSQCGNWQAGTYEFKAKFGDVEKTLEKINFKNSRKLNVLGVPVQANYAGVIVSPGNQWRNGDNFMRQVYPIAYNNISYKQGEIVDASNISYDLTTDSGREKLWERLNELKTDEIDLVIGYIENQIIVSPTDIWQGYTYGPPSSIVVNSDQDMEATVAHEVAHIFGIADEYMGGAYRLTVNSPPVGYVGKDWSDRNLVVTATDPEAKPFPSAQGSLISEKLNPFDTRGHGLLKDSMSFMGSGAAQSKNWITPSIWKHLFGAFTSSLATSSPLTVRSSQDYEGTRVTEASGWVSSSGQVELSLPWNSYITTEPVLMNSGTYRIQALDEGGSILASQGFTPSFFVRSNPPRTIDPAPFVQVMVPYPEGTKTFRVVDENEGTVLKEISISSGTPTLSVISPEAGQDIAGVFEIKWVAEDPDGDDLQYKVEYTPDGLSWDMLASGLTDNKWLQDFSGLPGGDGARIRVTASDGLNSAGATSGIFQMPLLAPKVYINGPESNSSLSRADGVIMHGSAYDPQEGQIFDDDRLIWSSNRDGELGRGPTVFAVNLTEGEHVLTLTATNSTGQSSSQSITVDITSSMNSSLTATPLVQVGNNPTNGNSVGIIVGLQNINYSNSNLLANPYLTDYTVEINFNPQKVNILGLTNLSTLGNLTSNINQQIEGKVIICYTGLTDTALNNLIFVSLNLIGTAEDLADVTVNFSSATDQNGDSITVLEPATVAFQRGKILNDTTNQEVSMSDAVAGLQYLSGLRNVGLDSEQVNMVNMASILVPDPITNTIAPNVKGVIALMQYLVQLRDPNFTVLSDT